MKIKNKKRNLNLNQNEIQDQTGNEDQTQVEIEDDDEDDDEINSQSIESSEDSYSSNLNLKDLNQIQNHEKRLLIQRNQKIQQNNDIKSNQSSSKNYHFPPDSSNCWSNSDTPFNSNSDHHCHYFHHHHHLYHHQQQINPQLKSLPLINPPRSNSEYASSTTCLDSYDSNLNSESFSPYITSNGSPQNQLPPCPNTTPLPQSGFFLSHHSDASPYAHDKPSHLYCAPRRHHPISDPSRFTSPSELSVRLDLASHPPKRSWFASRRRKRKHSIHALSATSTSSTTSLQSSPPTLDSHTYKSLDPLLSKYSMSSSASSSPSSSRRSSAIQAMRWMRSSISSPALPLRWFKKLLRSKLPLGILLGLLLFISFAVSLTTFLVHYLDTDKEPLPWRTYCQQQPEFPHQLADSLEPVNVFVGVFSVDSAYERRDLIRSTYARHSRPIDPLTGQISHNVQLKFILGKPRIQHVRRVALEMETYNDIVVLDIKENMNRGKTYAFLSWASENATIPVYYHPLYEPKPKTGVNGIGGVLSSDHMQTINVGVGFKKADFVVKADDDAFIVLSELERHLRVAPRTMTYWGYLIRNLFMGGECYALSADLVDYVATSEKVLNHLTGAEDKKVAKWMRIHPNASDVNWVTERCWIYDHPKAGTTYAHGFLFPDEASRIRDEAKHGLSESEIELRGPGRTQSYSSVIKWKQRYIAPKSLMTMEEEVEALVEGGGRFSKTDWKRPIEDEHLVPLDKVVFHRDDRRLLKSSIMNAPTSLKSTASLPDEFTPNFHDPYQEPSIKFGRPLNELMAKMPPMEDLPESPLKDKLREGLAGGKTQNSQETSGLSSNSDPNISSNNQKSGEKGNEDDNHGTKKQQGKIPFVASPTLRFDPSEMRLRNERFLNLPYGGTVVVHYLKRNEWFLEASLILLGRAKTWDDGLIPVVYEPSHKTQTLHSDHDHQLFRSTIEPDKNSVVVSSSTPSSSNHQEQKTSKDISALDQSPSFNENRNRHSQKKIVVNDVTDWGKFDQVEEIKVGGMFGGARMFGSPVIENDGTISQGRRRVTAQYPSTQGRKPNYHSNSKKDGNESENGDNIQHATDISLDGNDESVLGAGGVDNQGQQTAKNNEDEKDDDIRKTQFGGAGWIRGKPRLRVADELDGPRFINDQSAPAKFHSSFDQRRLQEDEHRSFDSQTGESSGPAPSEQEEPSKISHSPTTITTNSKSTSPASSNNQEYQENEDEAYEERFKFGNGSDSSLILNDHQHESLDYPESPSSSSSSRSGDNLVTNLLHN